MRLDKFLKTARIIKRRTVAKEACDGGRVTINDKVAKAGDEVKVGDIIEVSFGNHQSRFAVKEIQENVSKDQAAEMYEILS